jgi:hypothetical protein
MSDYRHNKVERRIDAYVPAQAVCSHGFALRHNTTRQCAECALFCTGRQFPAYAKEEPVPTLLQVLNDERPANTPPIRSEAAPGAKWKYSGGGYTIMQQVLIDTSKTVAGLRTLQRARHEGAEKVAAW